MEIKTISVKKESSDSVVVKAVFDNGYEWGHKFPLDYVMQLGLLKCIDDLGRHGRYEESEKWIDAAWEVRELISSLKYKY